MTRSEVYMASVTKWVDHMIATKGRIAKRRDVIPFTKATGLSSSNFGRWMKRAGLIYDHQIGTWKRD